MASNIPSQDRAVDPFASYNSNTVNVLTRAITHGEDGIANVLSCDVAIASTTSLTLNPGEVFKDDVWITISAAHIIDFTDSNHYYNFNTGFDEAGYYYIVLEYVFQKSRPAPQAKILIIKPSQRSSYVVGGSWILLKTVLVTGVGPFIIHSIYDWDVEDPSKEKQYIKTYGGGVSQVPTFDATRDKSRIAYSIEENNFYFGLDTEWYSLRDITSSAIVSADTSTFNQGDLVYTDHRGNVDLANSVLGYFFSEGVVDNVSVNGTIKTSGYVKNVTVETGITVTKGKLIYLSKTEPGKVTTEPGNPFSQFVGRCLVVVSSTVIDMIYHRGESSIYTEVELACALGQGIEILSPEWSIGGSNYYNDIDISNVDKKNAIITIWDATTELEITPVDIEFISDDIARVWVSDNTIDANIFIVGSSNSCATNGGLSLSFGLPSTSWVASGGGNVFPGANPSAYHFQDIDISDVNGKECSILIKDIVTNLQTHTQIVQFDTTDNLRIWTTDPTENLELSLIGPAALSSYRIIVFNTFLEKVNWNFWTNANLPDASLSLGVWGPGGSNSEWASSSSSTIWGGSDSTSVSIFTGLYYQDIDISIFYTNNIILELYNRANNKVITPTYTEFINLTTVRIWMDTPNDELNIIIIGRLET